MSQLLVDDFTGTTSHRTEGNKGLPDHDQKVESLMSMGVPFETASQALQDSNFDVHAAVDSLFSRKDEGESSGANRLSSRVAKDISSKEAAAKLSVLGNSLSRNKHHQNQDPDNENDEVSAALEQSGSYRTEDRKRKIKRLFHGFRRPRSTTIDSVTKSLADSTSSPSLEPPLQYQTLKAGDLAGRVKEYEQIVRSIADRTLRRRCGNCSKLVLKDEASIKKFMDHVVDQDEKIQGVPCQHCGDKGSSHSSGTGNLTTILSHLCHFDLNLGVSTRRNSSIIGRWSLRPRTGRSKSLGHGTGYGGEFFGPLPTKKAQPRPQQKVLSNPDETLTLQTLNALMKWLPDFEQPSSSNIAPVELQSLLHYSSFLDQLANLLRNNDLVEICSQSKLYSTMAAFLSKIGGHPATSVLVFEPRIAHKHPVSLLDVILGRDKRLSMGDPDTLQPLSQHIGCLADQCKIMLTGPDHDEDDKKLYQRLAELKDLLTASEEREDETDAQDANAWQKDLRVADVPDEYIINTPESLPSNPPLARPTGQMKRIMQEIARLQASLPDGIFVRYASSRPDLMRVLIVGPKDTPYENGLFEFDLQCNETFPTGPPRMLLLTTGSGTVRFNPNLYNSGQVCLSLLGTWSGEPWTSKSTLLQVLVSIQAMIFCEKPWYNEPGRETHRNDTLSDKYNTSLWSPVVQFGMLEWLPGHNKQKLAVPPLPEVAEAINIKEKLWGDVVQKHFATNRSQIAKTVIRWTTVIGQTAAPLSRHNSADTPDSDESLNQDLAAFLSSAMITLKRAPPLSS